ncbi:MAG: Type I restriction modification DNA specificity domain protein [Syntrophus sp. PtaB.Bin001]|nr:MAG: Type I restriction modification DNA specificity domain protein [Syntrophus sp. PtaB.Bin001]
MAGEWHIHEWGEIASLEYGKSLRDYRSESGLYRVFGTNGPVGWHDVPLCQHPGVIVGRKGAYRGIHYSKQPFFVIDTAFYLEPKQTMDLRWAYYCLLTYDINGMDSGSAIPSTSREAFYRLPVRVPPLKEQQAIACILGALDDKIELNRQMNRTLEEMARAIFKSWFVDFDPVRAKAAGRRPPGLKPEIAALFPDSFEDSELGKIPRGWSSIPLYDTASFINGAAFKGSDFCPPGEGFPVIKIAELKDGISSQTKWSPREAAPNQFINTGDLLYSWSGSPDTSLDAFLWTNNDGLLNQHIFKVVTPNIAQKRFVYYLLKILKPVLIEIARNKQTTGLGHVTVADMKRLKVCSPSKTILYKFDSLIGSFFDRAFACLIENTTLAALRDTLLPKLISGELRVPDAERIAGRIL